eukprot:EG_transcript_5256
MDFFKRIIDLDKDTAHEVDVSTLSGGDLEQMFLVKQEQLKAMTLQYDDLKGQHQTLQMEFDALKRRLNTVTKQQKRQRELDKEVILQLRNRSAEAGEDPYVVSLQERVEQLSDSVASLQQENSKLQGRVDSLAAENKAIEARKRHEADAYEQKVLGWKRAAQEIHERDQQLVAELRARLAEDGGPQPTSTGGGGRVAELEAELKAKAELLRATQEDRDSLSDKYVTALRDMKDLESRLYSLQPVPTDTDTDREGSPQPDPGEAALSQLEADRRRLYDRAQEAEGTVAALQAELSRLREESRRQTEALAQHPPPDSAGAELEARLHQLEASHTVLQERLRVERLQRDEAEQRAAEERKALQREKEAASWESVRLEKEVARLNDQLLHRQRDVEGLERAVQTAKEAAARQQREEVRALQRQVEELTERREADVAALTEQLEAKQAELDILQFKLQAGPEATPAGLSRGPLFGSLGPQTMDGMAARVHQLQEEAKFREQALEQFCNDTQEAQAQLRVAEERIHALSSELATREMEVEARDRTVQSLRARVDGLVEQLAQAQEEAEQVRSDAEQRVERLEEACAAAEAAAAGKAEEAAELAERVAELQGARERLQQEVDALLGEQRESDRRVRAQAAARREEAKRADPGDGRKAAAAAPGAGRDAPQSPAGR